MHSSTFGHQLETLQDGLTTYSQGEQVPVPLVATSIHVGIAAGVAIVRTTRNFRNAESTPIEALMTFPVGFDAVVTELAATIDGRRMVGVAKEKAEARDTYEAALDEGRLSVLHEEALRGIHILSIGALPEGAEVEVALEQVVPLADAGAVPFLRLPMTAGQVYGTSPFLPSDDLVVAEGVQHEATLTISLDQGSAMMDGCELAPDTPLSIVLDRALELEVEGGEFSTLQGRAADGRIVDLSLKAVDGGDIDLDVHVLVDRSGSTDALMRDGDVSVWQAMRDGLTSELGNMRPSDRVTLWQFDSDCQYLGTETGEGCANLPPLMEPPCGGTELAGAIHAALGKGAKDILVLTDGQTWAHMVEGLKGEAARISAILAGPNSFDANIGHLCALTGGQVLYAPGRNVASALQTAFNMLRKPGSVVEGEVSTHGPDHLVALRGGVAIEATWIAPQDPEVDQTSDAIGRFASALSLPLLETEAAETWARAHSLCTHSTSLVLVDNAGEATEGFSRIRKVPLMEARSFSHRSQGGMMMDMEFSASEDLSSAQFFERRASCFDANAEVAESRKHSSRKYFSAYKRPDTPDPFLMEKTRKSEVRPRFAEQEMEPNPYPYAVHFHGFAWDVFGDALLAGDFSPLNSDQMDALEKLAAQILSDKRWHVSSIDGHVQAKIIGLGLIASCLSDRVAKRFSRRSLEQAPAWASGF